MKTEGLNMLKSILIKLYKCVHYWAVNSKMIVTWFVHVWLTLYDEHNSQNIYTVRNFNACPIAVLFLLEIWLEPIWWDQAFSWFFHLCKWCPLTMSLVGSLCFFQFYILSKPKLWNMVLHTFYSFRPVATVIKTASNCCMWWHAKTGEKCEWRKTATKAEPAWDDLHKNSAQRACQVW